MARLGTQYNGERDIKDTKSMIIDPLNLKSLPWADGNVRFLSTPALIPLASEIPTRQSPPPSATGRKRASQAAWAVGTRCWGQEGRPLTWALPGRRRAGEVRRGAVRAGVTLYGGSCERVWVASAAWRAPSLVSHRYRHALPSAAARSSREQSSRGGRGTGALSRGEDTTGA